MLIFFLQYYRFICMALKKNLPLIWIISCSLFKVHFMMLECSAIKEKKFFVWTIFSLFSEIKNLSKHPPRLLIPLFLPAVFFPHNAGIFFRILIMLVLMELWIRKTLIYYDNPKIIYVMLSTNTKFYLRSTLFVFSFFFFFFFSLSLFVLFSSSFFTIIFTAPNTEETSAFVK